MTHRIHAARKITSDNVSFSEVISELGTPLPFRCVMGSIHPTGWRANSPRSVGPSSGVRSYVPVHKTTRCSPPARVASLSRENPTALFQGQAKSNLIPADETFGSRGYITVQARGAPTERKEVICWKLLFLLYFSGRLANSSGSKFNARSLSKQSGNPVACSSDELPSSRQNARDGTGCLMYWYIRRAFPRGRLVTSQGAACRR
jgi:hypothetical protein